MGRYTFIVKVRFFVLLFLVFPLVLQALGENLELARDYEDAGQEFAYLVGVHNFLALWNFVILFAATYLVLIFIASRLQKKHYFVPTSGHKSVPASKIPGLESLLLKAKIDQNVKVWVNTRDHSVNCFVQKSGKNTFNLVLNMGFLKFVSQPDHASLGEAILSHEIGHISASDPDLWTWIEIFHRLITRRLIRFSLVGNIVMFVAYLKISLLIPLLSLLYPAAGIAFDAGQRGWRKETEKTADLAAVNLMGVETTLRMLNWLRENSRFNPDAQNKHPSIFERIAFVETFRT